MARRKFASHQLLLAEDEMVLLTHWADELGMQLGLLSDAIHFDDAAPTSAQDMLEKVEAMRLPLERAAGLIRAYEIHRRSEIAIREAAHDDANAGRAR